MRLIRVSLFVLACSLVPLQVCAGVPVLLTPERHALYADFNNKVAGHTIGIGGGVLGEPVSLGNLNADVVQTSPGQNVLRISNDLTSSTARRLYWQSLGDAEIGSGQVAIGFDMTPSALDNFSVLVRERGGSSKSFLNLNFSAAGVISASDAAGPFTLSANSYAANTALHVDLIFDMDVRTSSIAFNGTTVASARPFGVADRGIGRLAIGYASGSGGSAFDLDNVVINGTLPLPVVLEADFQDKPASQPIGLGGAELHEPFAKDSHLDASVIEPVTGTRVLDLSASDLASARVLRWQFFDSLEIRSGLVILDFDMAAPFRDRYKVLIREPGTATQSFLNIEFQANGTIALSDVNGTLFLDGVTYNAGQVYQFRLIYNMDAGAYDIFRNGVPLLRERAHGVVDRGLGALLFGISNGANTSSHLQIDAVRVYASDAAAIPSELEFLQEAANATVNVPITPAFAVGAMNVFDQPVPDATPVTLEIAQGSGPAEASLTGATAGTTAGIATFRSLTIDMPGTYRLVARSLDTAVLNSVDIIVADAPEQPIFVDGFEDLANQ